MSLQPSDAFVKAGLHLLRVNPIFLLYLVSAHVHLLRLDASHEG